MNQIPIRQEFETARNWILNELIEPEYLEKIYAHGCWCAKFDPYPEGNSLNENLFRELGGPHVVDGLDQICKDWFKTRKCNDSLDGGSCTYKSYSAKTDKTDKETSGFYNFDITNSRCVSNAQNRYRRKKGYKWAKNIQNKCQADSCKIDSFFANKIKIFTEENPDFKVDQSDVCRPLHAKYEILGRSIDQQLKEQKQQFCIGEAPFLRISSDNSAFLTLLKRAF